MNSSILLDESGNRPWRMLCVAKFFPPFGHLNDNVGIKFENSLQIFQRIITSLFPMAFADSLVIFQASQDSSFSYR